MASDKSMYWLAAGVLAVGIGTRYGHENSPNEWVACAVNRTTEILNRVSERASSQAERTVLVVADGQDFAPARVQDAMARAEARAAQVMACRQATSARVHAALARIDSPGAGIEIVDDSE